MTTLSDLPTPALLLDLDVLEANLERMAQRAAGLGIALRPHFKTHKCIEIAERQRQHGGSGVTVSTLEEARVLAAHGFDDITWAYPLILSRLPEALEIAERVTLRLTIDSPEACTALERVGPDRVPLHVWLKVDCGYHRAGVDPSSDAAVELARRLAAHPALAFDGILSHSGHAYRGRDRDEIAGIAEQERCVMVELAERLRAADVEVPGVSVGSTPAMTAAKSLEGVTEARPGNYALFDYTQHVLGSCAVEECAATVLASVISCREDHCVVDAGALALSKDPGPAHAPTPTMGRVFTDPAGRKLDTEAHLISLSQEHGIVDRPLPVGTLLRILPNHACLAVACWDSYRVVRGEEAVATWRIWRAR